jgi:hypothetical protein
MPRHQLDSKLTPSWCLLTCTNTYTCTCTRSYTYTHTQTHTYTNSLTHTLALTMPTNLVLVLVTYIIKCRNNDLWLSGDFPKSCTNVTIIPKPGKYPTSNNYRPLALTSCICKTFERLVWYIKSNDILTEYQSGFRKRRRTMNQLVWLESCMREAFVRQPLYAENT